MHGHSPGSAILVNAEVDSMGGVIDGGVGIDNKTSPRQAAIEKAQAELRQEYDVREERRRELEFLEKGGNPLDFKLGPATSFSVQSTSFTDQLAEQFVTSEAKGSFALAASPHGDSVESSGRPGAPSGHEQNSADNLLLFDGENDLVESERNPVNPSRRNNVAPSEQSSQLDGNHNAKESEDSSILRFVVKSQAYARRNRSKTSRDASRACSTDLVQGGDGNVSSSLPSRHGSRDAKVSICETKSQKDHNSASSICNSKSTNPNGNGVFKTLASDNQLDMELDPVKVNKTATKTCLADGGHDVKALKDLLDGRHNQNLLVDNEKVPNTMVLKTSDLVGDKDGASAAPDCIPSEAAGKTEKFTSTGELNGFSVPNMDGKDMQNEGQNGSAALGTKALDSESSCSQISPSLNGDTTTDQSLNLKVNSSGNSKEQTLVAQCPGIADVDLVKQNNETNAVDASAVSNGELNCVHKNLSSNGSQVKLAEGMSICRSVLENEEKLANQKSEEKLVSQKTEEKLINQKNDEKLLTNVEGLEPNDQNHLKTDRKNQSIDNSYSKKTGSYPQGRPSSTKASSSYEPPDATFSGRGSSAASELQTFTGNHLKLATKAHEDSILEEARTIEAKRKRIAELSVGNVPLENRRKSHWDFVLEEMAWLANDFMQERLWKTTVAAQIGHWVAVSGRLRFGEKVLCQKQRKLANILAKAILQFWHSAMVILNGEDSKVDLKEGKEVLVGSQEVNADEAVMDKTGQPNKMDTDNQLEEKNPGQDLQLPVQGYAVRFLKYNDSLNHQFQAEAPATPDRISDLGIQEMSWEDQFSEESLFYTVPPGAMENYRKSVESYWAEYEKTGSGAQQEEIGAPTDDGVSEFGSRDNAYEEDEGETGAYYLPCAFEGSKSSKFAQKRHKSLQKSYSARSYDLGADLSYGQCMENKPATQSSLLTGKRPTNSLNVGSIPIKRMRTASRQRVVCPFGGGATGSAQAANKTDVSSGDTSSFQDDQSTLHGGSQFRKTSEVESTGDFGKPLSYDCTEISKPKKKKKTKHLLYKSSLNSTDTGSFVMPGKGAAYEQRWQLDSIVQNEQRDTSKKRLEGHHFEPNGNSGLFGQPAVKKPKIMKQLTDTSPESFTPMSGSIPSPVASQMSNMSNPNKLIKMIAGRDRGRKTKALKTPTGQSGSGSPWSLFEDQALVVLVHDMGPNWELVSDAINSTLQFKCIYRKPKECKERHKILMDRNAGDGADSAEDSGSSQPYPSTLPGIPKGSARQLFQRLQGPMEEDTLKAHFEKIIALGQQLHSHRSQNDNQDLKQIAPVHNSHVIALSQVCPNNLNGSPLTPLDLCNESTSSADVLSLGYQGSHTSGLSIPNQGSVAPGLPSSSGNTILQGSSGMVLGNGLPSPSAGLNVPSRDGQRYGTSRPGSLSIDEQQRMQQYNQMLSGRNIQQSGLSVAGTLPGTDRGVRMLPGGNGMGMMVNRGMQVPRPGFQGMGSPAMLNSGNMLPSSGVGMPSPVNMHTGAVSSQGSSMLRPRDAMHLMRPGQNPEDQRQMMMQELQMQVSQGNSQGVPPFSGMSTTFSNQTVPPPVQSFPVQHQQQHQMPQQSHMLSNPHHSHLQGTNHATSPQQQAYMLRVAKERQLQQRFLQQQQQQQQQQHPHQHQFSASNNLIPHAQSQSQHPISSPMQNNSQIQQQVSSQPVPLPTSNSQHPLTPSSPMNPMPSQPQQKQHHLQSHGQSRNPQASGGNLQGQMLKQRQQRQQQLQQAGRHHPQQRQQSQAQPQAKLMKGLGRGNMMMHHNLAIDPSHINGLSTPPGSHVGEKEQVMHLMQAQGLFPNSGSNSIQSGKPLLPSQSSNQCQPQQKLFSRPSPSFSKQLSPMPSLPDNSNQSQVPGVPSGHILGSQQAVPQLAMTSPHQQQQPQAQTQQRQAGQSPHSQRMLPPTRPVNSDPPMQSLGDHVQVGQQPLSGSFHMGINTTVPQSCAESTSGIPVVSSANAAQWKAPEPSYDSATTNQATNLAAIGNPSLQNPVGTEPIPSASPGLAQRQFSGSIPIPGHNGGTQWQPQPQSQQLSSSPSPPPPPQQQTQQQRQQQSQHQQQPQPQSQHQQQQQPPPPPQQQQVQQQQPPQQQQHLQAGQAGLYPRPTDSGPG